MNPTTAFGVIEGEEGDYNSNNSIFVSISNASCPQQSVSSTIQEHSLDSIFLSHTHNGHLYGRQKELAQLKEAYQRCLRQNSENELILISGKSGTGKTALATMIRDDVVNDKDGYFVVGKYNQSQRPEPYATIVSAFTDFVRMVIETDEENVKQIKEATIKCVGVEDIGILIDMLPSIEQILDSAGGLSLRPTTVIGAEAQTRIKLTFRNFIRGICSLKRPIVLLMDDMQWADVASLDLLEVLVADNKNRGLVILGVCRSSEVSYDHDFAVMLRNLEDEKNTVVTHIQLNNLTLGTTNKLVADTLKLPETKCQPFTEAIYSKTDGNVYFLLHLLQSLREDGILRLETTQIYGKQARRWTWDQIELDNYQKDQGIIDLVSYKITRLPHSTQLVLKTAACIGAEFEEYILSTVLEQSVDVANDLSIAIDARMIIPNKNGRHNVYVFSHDRIEQAAYALIADDQKDRLHFSIGKLLMENLSEEEMDMNLFLVVDQLSRGSSLLKDQDAKFMLASLCLQAGEKSMLSGDFKMAAAYFWRGVDFLGPKDLHWKNQYVLSLNLYNAAAEAEYCVPDFEKMDLAVGEVLDRAQTFRDKIRAYATQVYALGARDMMHDAISTGLFVLAGLGQPLPVSPNKANIIVEIAKTEIMLRGKTNRYIQHLPDAANPEVVEAMSMLNLISTYAFLAQKKIFPFIACRLVRLSLKHGLCAISAFGFAAYGLVCCKLGKFDSGYRWGELALSIVERYKSTEMQWIPRIYTAFFGMIAYRKQPMRSLIDKVWHGYRAGLQSGDVEYAMSGMHCYAKYAFLIGKPLPVIECELMMYSEKMESYKLGPVHSITKILHQTIHNLIGHNATVNSPIKLSGNIIDEDKEFEEAIDKNYQILVSNFLFYKMVLAYHLNDIEQATDIAKKSRIIEDSQIIACTRYFYDGMISFAAAASDKRSMQRNKRKHMSIARKNMRKVKKLSTSCANNFMHKWLLMKAEDSSFKGENIVKTMEYYDQAIDRARNEGFLQDEALACERAGLYALRNDFRNASVPFAIPYLKRAIGLYKEWGAMAKVHQMIAQHENLDLHKKADSTKSLSSLGTLGLESLSHL